jgi:hypothetical protein
LRSPSWPRCPPAPTSETAADAVRQRVHAEVRSMMRIGEGRVLFTDLWNGERLSAAEREYAARLYEVFFALPAHVQDELRARGAPPSPAEIAANFGLAPDAVDLLLAVMTSEPSTPTACWASRSRSPSSLDELAALVEPLLEEGPAAGR